MKVPGQTSVTHCTSTNDFVSKVNLPSGHLHSAALQTKPLAQTDPHRPQFSPSVLMLMLQVPAPQSAHPAYVYVH